MSTIDSITLIAFSSFLLAGIATCCLLFISIKHHTRTGPKVKETIEQHYSSYVFTTLLRLSGYSTVIIFSLSFFGSLIYLAISLQLGFSYGWLQALLSGSIFTALVVVYLFCYHLLYTPSLLLASAQFRFSRLHPLWTTLSPNLLKSIKILSLSIIAFVLIGGHIRFFPTAHLMLWLILDALIIMAAAPWLWANRLSAIQPQVDGTKAGKQSGSPNIVMIGTDTLRADRLGVSGYHRNLSPNIDRLTTKSTYLKNCYTPLARTAPSLTSLLTGSWPHTHKIRSNFPSAADLKITVPNMVEMLNNAGYETAAIGDWAAADLGKMNFGFKKKHLPDDQWNIKYLIRQGPATFRLFLSLFAHNPLGRKLLPEIYYLAGVPLSQQTGEDCRQMISQFAKKKAPFYINYFSAATHVPFGSNYPYYQLYADPDYKGDSQFIMTSVNTPEEIIASQEKGEEYFDLPQINALYDGCIKQFDDEVGKILKHLKHCGLEENTIVVIYSDHGADFFENGCWGQGNTLLGDDPSNRVPIIIYDPSNPTAHVIDTSTRLIDIAPTVLDISGISPPQDMDGCSLTDIIANPSKAVDLHSYHESGIWLSNIPGMRKDHLSYPNILDILDIPDKELGMLCIKGEYIDKIIEAKDRSIRDQKWKLIYQPTLSGCDYLLFDMSNDPQCTTDVKLQHPDIFSDYKNLLDKWISQDPIMTEISAKSTAPNTPHLRQ
jgi:arylsulfatase A-like enzyme